MELNNHQPVDEREQLPLVVVGHVDHGKSTILGRLLHETSSLPEGKLEQIKEKCQRESRVFEYAYLLDALKDEQQQGITIDIARCFFKTQKRDYIIIDAPGHIEFLKNMISGAASAEAALLVIDAQEGVQENSRRHGYMLSLLGIKQVVVCINKMDLVGHQQEVFERIKNEYTAFLEKINIMPKEFIPVSALQGDNISQSSQNLSWFTGNTILSALDSFEKQKTHEEKPFRMPVQDVYKFSGKGDNRRIVAGAIEANNIQIGQPVIFLPSNKKSTIKTIEGIHGPLPYNQINTGYPAGLTLTEQIYIKRGEIMCKEGDQLPHVATLLKTNVFWMSKTPLQQNKEYKLKIHTASVPMKVKEIIKVMDASNLSSQHKTQVDRHEIAECILECQSPLAFDLAKDFAPTGRFVIVDDYNIAGGGIINDFIEDTQSKLRSQVFLREQKWEKSLVSFEDRVFSYAQQPNLVLITGKTGIDKKTPAKLVEKQLFEKGRKVYFLGIGNLLRGLDADIDKAERKEHIRRLAEVSHILMDAGLIVLATACDLTKEEMQLIKTITGNGHLLIVNIGEETYEKDLVDLYLEVEEPFEVQVMKIINLLKFKNIVYSK